MGLIKIKLANTQIQTAIVDRMIRRRSSSRCSQKVIDPLSDAIF